jgi:2-amino-4-hydroxy-6-hydroxymethyldihydropteridine diphosphokinase
LITAYLGLGSNIGKRMAYISNAFLQLHEIANTTVIKSSSIYETEPWGKSEQNNFLNSVVEIETELSAMNLFKIIKSIEELIGRTETEKWYQREIDIDLLFYGNEIIENDFMKVPHKEIENRKFVLIPMNEITPDFIHPIFKKNISTLLKETRDTLKVEKYNYKELESWI